MDVTLMWYVPAAVACIAQKAKELNVKKMKFISINSTACSDSTRVDVSMADADGVVHTFGADLPPGATAETASLFIRVLCNEMLIRDGAEAGKFPKYGV